MGSGAPAFAPLCLRIDDKAARVGMPDLSLLSPPATKSAAEESRRHVVGFAQAAARAAAMAPAAPALGLQSQSQQQAAQQQQARKVRRCWSTELHRQFVAALNQLGGPQGKKKPSSSDSSSQIFLPILGHQHVSAYYLTACHISNTNLELMSSFMLCHVCSCHPKANQGADEGGWADK